MKVDVKRTMDRWVGIPLTFLLTCGHTTVRLFAGQRGHKPRNILFMKLSGMGSTLLADPAMKKAGRELEGDLFFAIYKKNRGSLDLLGTIRPNHIFTIRENNLLAVIYDTVRFLFWLRRNKIDTVIDLELFSRFTALLTGLSGAPTRVGFYGFYNEGQYRGELLTHRVAYNPHIHLAKNFVSLVNSLLAAAEEVPYSKKAVTDEEIKLPVMMYHETELANMHELVRRHYPEYDRMEHRLVLINTIAGDLLPQRRWMPERYVGLMRRILEETPDALILITGAAAEKEEAEVMRGMVNDERCVNFAGSLQLGQLPVLYTIAELMVTDDSGPAHFSAITELPTFVLFGPETPGVYGSLGNSAPIYAGLACSPCVSAANHRKTACTDNKCMQEITVDRVLAAIRPVLFQGRYADKGPGLQKTVKQPV